MTDEAPPPEQPRHILLATDLSARCDRALDRASALAGDWGADLVVVHAVEQEESGLASELARRLPVWRTRQDAARMVEEGLRLDMRGANPTFRVVVEKATPERLILDTAAREGCDLIVTGVARDEPLGRFGLGHTVDRLLKKSRVPELIVRQRLRGPYGRVVAAIDFSAASRHALRTAAAFFPHQWLDAFHAYQLPALGLHLDQAAHREAVRAPAAAHCADFVAAAGLPAARRLEMDVVVERGQPLDLLLDYVREKAVDLVVLGRHERGPLADFLIGSVARDVLCALPCDVLIVPEPAPGTGS